ncbi:MAG: transglutaminase-like domain-containing protein, partial [Gemmatimonadota bacterium]
GARLAEAALTVSPGAMFYRLSVGGQQVGYASTTVDTLVDSLRLSDVLVVDMPALGRLNRSAGSSVAMLDRSLHLLELRSEVDGVTLRFAARPAGAPGERAQVTIVAGGDSVHAALPALDSAELPSLWPLRLAFGGGLHTGRTAQVHLFDPFTAALRERTLRVTAESTFVVADSADFDSTAMAWVPLRFDTVRAFRVDDAGDGGGGASSTWIDAQGRVVRVTTPLGFTAERTAFEIAYENFRHRDTLRLLRTANGGGIDPDDIVPTTLVTAGQRPDSEGGAAQYRVRLAGGALDGLALDGGRQHLTGDTLTVVRERGAALVAQYRLPDPDPGLRAYLEPDLLISSQDLRVAAQARIVAGPDRDPRRVATRLVHWVATAVRRERTDGIGDAAAVLERRRGDANEHTVLFVAMARALGLPARPVAGLVRAAGQTGYYYHAWAEVYLGDWVAVDPTFDQLPADAVHLRLAIGALVRPTDFARQLGRLTLEPS